MLLKVKSPEIASCQLPFNILSSDAEPYRQNGSYCRARCRRQDPDDDDDDDEEEDAADREPFG
jgi:hypothetical protein